MLELASVVDSQPLPVIGICHRTRLFAECLQRSLAMDGWCDSRLLEASEVLQGKSASFNAPATQATPPLGLLLLDVALAAGEFASLVDWMRRQFPSCKLLLLVPELFTERLVGLTQWGSHGCVRENGTLHELCQAIHLVMEGKHFFAPELANVLFSQLNGVDPQQPWVQYADATNLTPRQREVLRLITWEDLGNKQIARRLHVSLYTVKNHVHSIIEKLRVNDRHDAARLARRRNLVGEALGESAAAGIFASSSASLG